MTQRFRLAAIHVALVAILLRAMLPVGWMPDAHGITICSATLGLIHHDAPPGQGNGSDHQNSHEECPFAAAPHAAVPISFVVLAVPSSAFAWTRLPSNQHAVRDGLFYGPQAPRGPPQSA